jgi:hypothetical protein
MKRIFGKDELVIGVVVNPIGMTRAKFFERVVKFLLSIGDQ